MDCRVSERGSEMPMAFAMMLTTRRAIEKSRPLEIFSDTLALFTPSQTLTVMSLKNHQIRHRLFGNLPSTDIAPSISICRYDSCAGDWIYLVAAVNPPTHVVGSSASRCGRRGYLHRPKTMPWIVLRKFGCHSPNFRPPPDGDAFAPIAKAPPRLQTQWPYAKNRGQEPEDGLRPPHGHEVPASMPRCTSRCGGHPGEPGFPPLRGHRVHRSDDRS
ncbi:unnamed protein product [Anisakis simplex]|uniref:Uncharacterized protein n=1 Tax=Anisakis simplex TaxID=6269 RepID=A0A0M3K8G6_ANISI|nr:unnamed protein product [Anisakis simplex]